jgi:hypothetical protein
MSTQQLRKLVVIEDSMVLSMAQNQNFLSEFPFLAGLTAAAKKKKAGCSACGSANRERGQVLNAAKAAIAGMSPEKKKRMLKLLNAEKMRVIYSDGAKTLSRTIEGG